MMKNMLKKFTEAWTHSWTISSENLSYHLTIVDENKNYIQKIKKKLVYNVY